jgi:hypothetical protein
MLCWHNHPNDHTGGQPDLVPCSSAWAASLCSCTTASQCALVKAHGVPAGCRCTRRVCLCTAVPAAGACALEIDFMTQAIPAVKEDVTLTNTFAVDKPVLLQTASADQLLFT